MAEAERPFRASYVISGVGADEVYAALLDVRRFPEWALGLSRARALDAAGTTEVRPGTSLEFTLNAGGLTHKVVGAVTVVEPPRRLEWRYAEGAKGNGGWLIEESDMGTVRMTLSTDYRVRPAWLDRLAHKPFFRGLTEDLFRRSIRRFEAQLRKG